MKNLLIYLALFTVSAYAQGLGKSGEVKIITNESGFIVCTGGTNQPLFSKTCNNLNMYRVSSGGAKYEGTCLDSNGTTFYLACEAFNFEYSKKFPIQKSDMH